MPGRPTTTTTRHLEDCYRHHHLDHGSRTSILGGSWVVISGVISRVTMLITHIRGLKTPLMTIH